MRLSIIAAFAAVALPFAAFAAPQVCRQAVEGYDTFTDCYGMELTGASLRAAQIRDLINDGKTPAEIAMLPGVKVVTVRSTSDSCPRGSTWIGSTKVAAEAVAPVYDVQCAD